MYRLTILLIVCLGYTFADQLSANDEINLLNYLSLNTDLVKNLESFENVARGEVPEDAKLLVVCISIIIMHHTLFYIPPS